MSALENGDAVRDDFEIELMNLSERKNAVYKDFLNNVKVRYGRIGSAVSSSSPYLLIHFFFFMSKSQKPKSDLSHPLRFFLLPFL